MKKTITNALLWLIMAGLGLSCIVGTLIVSAPIEPVYGAAPRPLPPTFTPEGPTEYPVKAGLTIQSISRPGVSFRIEEIRQEKCARSFGVFSEEKLVVFYTTNNVIGRSPLTSFLCVTLNTEGEERDSRLLIRSKILNGKQELFLVVDPGWKRIEQ